MILLGSREREREVGHPPGSQPHRHSKDILILEDDCLFQGDNPKGQMSQTLETLKNEEWTLCFFGSASCFPLLPWRLGIWRTMIPSMAHCYLFKNSKLRKMLKQYPAEEWIGPQLVEFWLKVPLAEKFAVVPCLAVQDNIIDCLRGTPVEWVSLNVFGDPTMGTLQWISHCMAIWVLPVLMFVILVIVTVFLGRRN